MDKLSAGLCGVFMLFALFAGWMFSVFALQVYWGAASSGWTPVAARVIEVEAGDNPGRARYGLRYAYQAEGEREGDTASFAGDEQETRQLVAALAPGAALTVYADPAAPQRSVVLPGTSFSALFFAAVGLFLTLIPASFALGLAFAGKGGARFERALDAFVLLLLLFFALLPAGAAALVGAQVWRGAASGGWPQVQGTVVISAGREVAQAEQSRRFSVLPGRSEMQLAYAYTAAGRSCVGSAYDALRDFPAARRTGEILRALPKGAGVAVRYNPESPCQALLAPGVGAYGLLMLAMSLGFTLLFGWPALRKLRRLAVPGARRGARQGARRMRKT